MNLLRRSPYRRRVRDITWSLKWPKVTFCCGPMWCNKHHESHFNNLIIHPLPQGKLELKNRRKITLIAPSISNGMRIRREKPKAFKGVEGQAEIFLSCQLAIKVED